MLTLLNFLLQRCSYAHFLVNGLVLHGPQFCHAIVPTGPYHALYDSLLCGEPLPQGEELQLFVDTGLIHLLVISGLHLMYIERALGWLPRRVFLLVLFGYTYLTGFHPPVVKAFNRRLDAFARWKLTPLQAEAAGNLALLVLLPQWLMSRSFLMSWMGGLATTTPALLKHRHLDRTLKAYVLLLPFCWASPLTLAWNLLFVPIVGILLFPACVLAALLPPTVVFSDALWTALIAILKLGPHAPPLAVFYSAAQLLWLPPLMHILFLCGEVQWRRAYAFSV